MLQVEEPFWFFFCHISEEMRHSTDLSHFGDLTVFLSLRLDDL
jgi:hypothetical protein